MTKKPPVDPESLPVAEAPRESRFIRSSRTPEEREAARKAREARSATAREERLRRRREAEAEAERTGVPLPPRRGFIQERTDEEKAAEDAEREEVEEGDPLRDDAFIWRPNKDFPAYLRKVREDANISLRQAAPALGMSAAYLSRLETGGPARQPSLERLNRMAALYNVSRHAMYEAAGVHVGLPENYDMLDYTDDEFEALMMDPALQPGMMTHEALNYFSPRMKRQVVEFAKSLAALDDPAAYLNHLLQQVRGLE